MDRNRASSYNNRAQALRLKGDIEGKLNLTAVTNRILTS